MKIEDRLGFNFKSVTAEAIAIEFNRASDELDSIARNLPPDLETDKSIMNKPVSDHQLRPAVKEALQLLGLQKIGKVRVRQLWPNGILLRWNTAGIYIPHAFEGQVDHGQLSVQKPYTMAHEMAHGFGVTDEGTCNFIAWLACAQSDDPWMRYSGALTYWKYVAFETPADTVRQKLKTFPPVIEKTLQLIRDNDKKYPDLFPKYRDAIYSSYLKHHGVTEGLRSYNEVVLMVQQYLAGKQIKK